MFSKQITESDAFLDMPVSSQLLYFHLNMGADDDGFVANPKRIMRMVGVQDDDMKILLSKRFLLAFKNGVVVIKHWLLHNCVRRDMYKETQYIEEKKQIKLKENNVYTEVCNEPVTKPLHRLDKVRLGQDRLDKDRKELITSKDVRAKAQPREDINILLEKLNKLLGMLDESKKNQRWYAKLFLDSKTPEILARAGNSAPTKEQIINATLRLFQLAMQDSFHQKNCRNMKYVYNKAASIATSQKTKKYSVDVIS